MINTKNFRNKVKLLFPYIKRKTKLTKSYILYKTQKRLSINTFELSMNKAFKDIPAVFDKDFKNKFKENINNTLISEKFEENIKEFKKDRKFLKVLKEESDTVLDRNFAILGEYITEEFIYDYVNKKYKWHYDFKADYKYIISHYTKTRELNSGKNSDIKNLWELSRMQYLFAPALYWQITKEERYAQFIVDIISDWIDNNQCEEGPNWDIAMEAGIRITNMILMFQLIYDSPSVTNEFIKKFYTSVYQHLHFILNNEENFGGRTYNHYLGGLIGLCAIVTTFPRLDKKSKILNYVSKAAHTEINKQVLDDGMHFEGSTSYHMLVGEIFSYIGLMLQNSKIKLGNDYIKKLYQMAIFSIAITKDNNEVVQVGDNDGGRIFILGKDSNLNHHQFINLALTITKNKQYSNYYKYINSLFTGKTNFDKYYFKEENINFFPDSKIVIYRTQDVFLLVNASEPHLVDMGGHSHNDKLSFELNYKGKNFIVDPGTGYYTSNKKIRNKLRSVKSHSTLTINNIEQNKFSSRSMFELFYNTKSQLNYEKSSEGIKIYGQNNLVYEDESFVHYRDFLIRNKSILVQDEVTGRLEDIKFNLPLDPHVKVKKHSRGILLENDSNYIEIITDNEINVIKGLYSPNYSKVVRTNIIEFSIEIDSSKMLSNQVVFKFIS